MDDSFTRFEILDVDDSVVAGAETIDAARYACRTLLTSDEDRCSGYRTLQILDLRLGRVVETAHLVDGDPPGCYIESVRDPVLV